MKVNSTYLMQKKLTQSSKKHDNDKQIFGRFNTTNSIHIGQSTSQELKKIISSLDKTLKQQRQKRTQVQETLLLHFNRSDERQKQFHKILANLDPKVFLQSSSDTNIQNLHDQIIGKFSQSQQKLRQKFEARYKENLRIMQTQIKNITDIMERQLLNASTLSVQQHGQLKANINRLQTVALQIDMKNTELIKEKQSLYFRIKLLTQEKNLLIEQLTKNKMLARKYFEKVKKSSKNQQKSQRSHSQIICEKNSIRSRKNSLTKKQIIKKPMINDSDTFAFQLVKSKVLPNEFQRGSNSFANTFTVMGPKKEYISSMTLGTINSNKRTNQTQYSRNQKNSPYIKDNSCINNLTFVNLSAKQNSQALSPQNNTINSLRSIVQRQKQKKLEFQKKLAQIQQKIIKIDTIIVDSFIFMKQKQEEDEAMNNSVFKRNNFKQIQSKKQQSDMTKLFKKVCDQIKNIISGNDSFDSFKGNSSLGLTLFPETIASSARNVRNLRNQQLTNLLKIQIQNEDL